MTEELREIRKIYGEEMMHLCRDLFPTILEDKGKLLSILKKNIAPTHSLAIDIKENEYEQKFRDWIDELAKDKKNVLPEVDKNPFELMEEAGYILVECHNEEEIQAFKKYYAPGEELCTFRGGRLDRCHVFFAVKKNVNDIKRENFSKPGREDEYGTSVISIQFSHGDKNSLSIKNRYNHTVSNPDATFSNNLENIIPGLTRSFENAYGYKIDQEKEQTANFLTNKLQYVLADDGRYYRFNIEYGFVLYCENNVVIRDGVILSKLYMNNKERFLLADDVKFDFKDKAVYGVFNPYNERNAFADSINEVGRIQNIFVTKENNNRVICIKYCNGKLVKVILNKQNGIIGYINNDVKRIKNLFLCRNRTIKQLELNSVKTIGSDILSNADDLSYLNLPNVEKIGDWFMPYGRIKQINLPNVKSIGNAFMFRNQDIQSIDLPKLETVGNNFMNDALALKQINIPNIVTVEDGFVTYSSRIESIYFPKLESAGDFFLSCVNCEEVYLPNLIKVGGHFFDDNNEIKVLELPKVERIGYKFLFSSKSIEKIIVPNLKSIDLSNQSRKIMQIIDNCNENMKGKGSL